MLQIPGFVILNPISNEINIVCQYLGQTLYMSLIIFLVFFQIYSPDHTNNSFSSNPSTPVGSPPSLTGKHTQPLRSFENNTYTVHVTVKQHQQQQQQQKLGQFLPKPEAELTSDLDRTQTKMTI